MDSSFFYLYSYNYLSKLLNRFGIKLDKKISQLDLYIFNTLFIFFIILLILLAYLFLDIIYLYYVNWEDFKLLLTSFDDNIYKLFQGIFLDSGDQESKLHILKLSETIQVYNEYYDQYYLLSHGLYTALSATIILALIPMAFLFFKLCGFISKLLGFVLKPLVILISFFFKKYFTNTVSTIYSMRGGKLYLFERCLIKWNDINDGLLNKIFKQKINRSNYTMGEIYLLAIVFLIIYLGIVFFGYIFVNFCQAHCVLYQHMGHENIGFSEMFENVFIFSSNGAYQIKESLVFYEDLKLTLELNHHTSLQMGYFIISALSLFLLAIFLKKILYFIKFEKLILFIINTKKVKESVEIEFDMEILNKVKQREKNQKIFIKNLKD